MNKVETLEKFHQIQSVLKSKLPLRRFYLDAYKRYSECLKRCPQSGVALELGSGGGFAKEQVPEIQTSDVDQYPNLDLQIDATQIALPDQSVRMFALLNVFHHIPNVEKFFSSADRCLMQGGRILIIDHYPGWWSRFLLKFIHHEHFDPSSVGWTFRSKDPLADSNTALVGKVFFRDRDFFEEKFPNLKIRSIEPSSPLFYWLAGGLKSWSLIPNCTPAIALAQSLDHFLLWISRGSMASFVAIEIERT